MSKLADRIGDLTKRANKIFGNNSEDMNITLDVFDANSKYGIMAFLSKWNKFNIKQSSYFESPSFYGSSLNEVLDKFESWLIEQETSEEENAEQKEQELKDNVINAVMSCDITELPGGIVFVPYPADLVNAMKALKKLQKD